MLKKLVLADKEGFEPGFHIECECGANKIISQKVLNRIINKTHYGYIMATAYPKFYKIDEYPYSGTHDFREFKIEFTVEESDEFTMHSYTKITCKSCGKTLEFDFYT